MEVHLASSIILGHKKKNLSKVCSSKSEEKAVYTASADAFQPIINSTLNDKKNVKRRQIELHVIDECYGIGLQSGDKAIL